jgi:hypothetical protein
MTEIDCLYFLLFDFSITLHSKAEDNISLIKPTSNQIHIMRNTDTQQINSSSKQFNQRPDSTVIKNIYGNETKD